MVRDQSAGFPSFMPSQSNVGSKTGQYNKLFSIQTADKTGTEPNTLRESQVVVCVQSCLWKGFGELSEKGYKLQYLCSHNVHVHAQASCKTNQLSKTCKIKFIYASVVLCAIFTKYKGICAVAQVTVSFFASNVK